jgi:MFS superfamily sulfate permease-like transporter
MATNNGHPQRRELTDMPRGSLAGFKTYWKKDLLAGFLVFLIALPLCLGIARACGYPSIAGVFTAIIGGVLSAFLSNSELTIKGPAAGLIVIAIGCVQDFGGDGEVGGFTATDMQAYRIALGIGVAAAVLQILFAAFRSGILGEFFPSSAVHGMLAAIGVIIIAKQFPIAMGLSPEGEPLELLRKIPQEIAHANPEIALISVVSLIILFGLPLMKNRYVRMVPGPMLVILVTVPMGIYFDLSHDHTYTFLGHEYAVGEKSLVTVPNNMLSAVTLPDFSGLVEPKAWKWVMMFALIGSLESLLSCKAVDVLDPWKRKTNLDRDLLAVGVGNLAAACVGGLPMISEIVRSRANIDNGARTRFANLFHGLFLLVFVASVPAWIHRIPVAALAAMLIYTGFRLAHPREFLHVFRIGKEQLIIYVTTIVAVLATDLLIGIAIGIGVKFLIHLINGVPISSIFRPSLDVEELEENTCLVRARDSAVFSNWIPLRRQIENLGLNQNRNIVLDLSQTKLVDHSVMEKLYELEQDFTQAGLRLEIVGLETHRPLSPHPHSARKKGFLAIRRITIVTEPEIEDQLSRELAAVGASGYTLMDCSGVGRTQLSTSVPRRETRVRFEVLATSDVAERILDVFRKEIAPHHKATLSIETVEVFCPADFAASPDPHCRPAVEAESV